MEPYLLRRTLARRLTLKVLADGRLQVSAPWYVPKAAADRFVADQAGWIEERRRVLASAAAGGTEIAVWGRPCRLEVSSPGRIPRVLWDEETSLVTLRVPETWTATQRQKALDRWEKDRVVAALTEAVPRWETVTGQRSSGWTVKRLRSRWGSCRPDTQTLVFNARLGAFPPECLDYVVVHELAHLVEASHNARFHALVNGWFPGAPDARKRLKGP